MSTNHYIYCQTCNKSHVLPGYDCSEENIQDIINAGPILVQIKQLIQNLPFGYTNIELDLKINYSSIEWDDIGFIEKHQDHHLGVITEYEAMDKEAYPWEE